MYPNKKREWYTYDTHTTNNKSNYIEQAGKYFITVAAGNKNGSPQGEYKQKKVRLEHENKVPAPQAKKGYQPEYYSQLKRPSGRNVGTFLYHYLVWWLFSVHINSCPNI